jgi:soluble lytic murein transglycosylase-like protein
MKKTFVIAVTAGFLAAGLNAATSRVVISNDDKEITLRRDGKVVSRVQMTKASLPVAALPRVRVPAGYATIIDEAAQAHGVDPRLIAAVIRRESAWNPNALSRVGASGLMQLMPATARELGVTNIFDVRQNIFGGTRYLRSLLDRFNGDLDLTLAAYNAGPGAVKKYKGVPPYAETRAYVRAVRAAYASPHFSFDRNTSK